MRTVVVCLAAYAVVTTTMVGWLWNSGLQEQQDPLPSISGESRALAASLEDLRELVDSLRRHLVATQLPARVEAVTDTASADTSNAALIESNAILLREVRRLGELSGVMAHETSVAASGASPPKDPVILAVASKLDAGDRFMRQSVLLRTPAEVLGRFGFPSSIQSGVGSMTWRYDTASGGGVTGLTFLFSSGMVSSVSVDH
jgi:hypothetical protein